MTEERGSRKRYEATHRGVTVLAASLIVLFAAGTASADDWPQFRGQDRDGVSHETGLSESWPEAGPPELWRVPLGAGFSGVAAVGGRLYTMDSQGEEEHVVCLDAKSGREVWRTPVGQLFRESTGNGPRSTPTVDGDLLWALASYGDLVALRTATGEEVWSVSLPRRFGTEMLPFGFASMPLVVGDNLVVEASGVDGYSVVAFDKRSGEIAWHAATAGMSYASPIRIHAGGVEQLVFLNVEGLVSLSPDGEILWSAPFPGPGPMKVAMPVFAAPDGILVSASYDTGAMMVRMKPGPSAGEVGAEVAWQNRRMRNHFSTSVAHDGLVYGFDNATLKALDGATGEQLWAKRGGFGKGSLVYADGHLIVLTEHGKLLLVEAGGEAYRELGAVQLVEERTWAPPSLADGTLYVRAANELVALGLRVTAPRDDGEALASTATGEGALQPATATAEDEVDAIVQRYVEARGGAEALAAVETLRQSGRYFFNGEAYPFTAVYERSGAYRFEAKNPDGRLTVVASDGSVGWRDNTLSWKPFATEALLLPLTEISAEHLALLLEDDADFEGPLVDYRAKGHQVSLVASEELDDGTPVYHLRVELQSGRTQHWYLHRETFLAVRRTADQFDTMGFVGDYVRNWYFDEYHEVDGVLVPVSFEREDFQLVRTFEVERVEVNVALDEALFAMPRAQGETTLTARDPSRAARK